MRRTPIALSILFAAGLTVAEAEPWKRYATPEAGGFSADKLELVWSEAERLGSAAVMIVHRGHVVAARGDVARPYETKSMRKSLVSALFGEAVAQGRIDLDATLAELGIDDLGGLTETERRATVRDLLAARSGIYHPAAYEPASMARSRPERGSHAPGEHWFYNNWDFNAVATIYERATGRGVFEAFATAIAAPIGMEDFDREDTFWWREPCTTRHPAYLFWLSVRDRARFGQLFLDAGRWHGQQVVPAAWVERSTSMATAFDDGNGYGLMWWVYPAHQDATFTLARHAGFAARGAGGQVIVVVPGEELVFAHAAEGEAMDSNDAIYLASLALEAKLGPPAADAELVPLEVEPSAAAGFESVDTTVPDEVVDGLVGTYDVGEGFALELHRHAYEGVGGEEHRGLFQRPIGPPFPETELFVPSPDRLVSPVGRLEIEVRRDADGKVSQLVLQRPDQRWVATRR